MEKMEALTTNINLKFKVIQGEMKEMRDRYNNYGGSHPSSECDDKQLGGPEGEANYVQGGYQGGRYHENYYVMTKLKKPKKKSDPPPIKAYTPHISYPQRLRSEKIEERYAKFMDMIKEFRINVPFVDVLAGMPNYEKFLKDLMEEDSRVPLIQGRPFLQSTDTIIYVKRKELNLGVRNDRVAFLIDKKSIQDPPTDLEIKPLHGHLEYAFLEKDFILLVVISALLKDKEEEHLVSMLKNTRKLFLGKPPIFLALVNILQTQDQL
ncbi:hypothetical protein Tco_0820271 [Tanacetum coccineum]|uniref:Reverse transcriptase domain-containing protein n=1 Tax=Tanacetum coccineum TaxID=301880 RepID=A0ABQ5ABI7_9ASTR